jgi:hypothetical protein
MARYYYGTVPALAWILNHYFYGRVHYSWLAECFHPLKSNPKSSNPYLIYGDLMWAWSDRDEYDKYVAQLRHGLARGALARNTAGVTDPVLTRRLKRICKTAPAAFFYPLVYRVPIDGIGPARQTIAGSGTVGSREILVTDLREHEFDLLFADDRSDSDLARLVVDEQSGTGRTSPADALRALERRLPS